LIKAIANFMPRFRFVKLCHLPGNEAMIMQFHTREATGVTFSHDIYGIEL
jgi:hypothetical protein